MRKFKKVYVLGLVVVIGINILGGCGKDATSEKTNGSGAPVVKIGTANGSLCLAPLHIAEDNGYFKEEFEAAGVEYELVEIELAQAGDHIASGKIDACVGLAGSLIPQIDSGLDISFTGGLHTGCTKFYVNTDSGIDSIADLKGKKIGVPGLGDSSVVALKRELFDQGIGVSADNMEVEWVSYNLTDLPLALDNRAVDVVALHDPVAYQAEQEYGFKKIFDLAEDERFSKEYCCQIYVTNELAQEYPEAAAAYTRALLKASAFVQHDAEAAAKIQIDNGQCAGELKINAMLLESYNYTPSVSLAKSTFQSASDELIKIGDLQEGIILETFIKEHFKEFDKVPDSYIFNDDGTFTEVD